MTLAEQVSDVTTHVSVAVNLHTIVVVNLHVAMNLHVPVVANLPS